MNSLGSSLLAIQSPYSPTSLTISAGSPSIGICRGQLSVGWRSSGVLEVIPGDETKKSGDDATFRRYCEENALLPSPEEQGKSCNLMFSQMTIDCEGDAYICCVAPTLPSMRLGKFLELSADEILAKRFVHPFCRGCKYPRHDRTAEEAAWLSCIEPLIEKERADLEHHALDHHKVQGPATGLPLGI